MKAMLCLAMMLVMGAEALEAQCRGSWCRDRDHGRRSQPAGPPELGVRGGYDFGDETAMAGVQVRIPIIRQLLLLPSADVFFDDSPSEWQANLDLAVRPSALGGVYGGAGVAFLDREFTTGEDRETQVGYNILAGLEGGRIFDTRLRPYVEARWSGVDDYTPFRLVVGGNVPLR